MKQITILDIAAQTGFSKSSVSAALNHNPKTNAKTAEFIRETAQKMGYSPDPVFSEMGRRRWKREGSTIGENLVFLMDPFTLNGTQKESPEELSQLQEYARSKGYRLDLRTTDTFSSVSQANREFYAKGIRGLMTSLRDPKDELFLTELKTEQMAVVTHETDYDLYHSITINWPAMISTLLHKMVAHGRKNISVILIENIPTRFPDELRIGSVLALQRKLPATLHLHTIPRPWAHGKNPDPIAQQTRKDLLKKILKEDHPDAIIGHSAASFFFLQELGLNIPQDIGYAAMIAADPCSGIQFKQLNLWKAQLDKLIAQIRNADFGRPESPLLTLHTPPFIDAGTF